MHKQELDYGPIAELIGKWEGATGEDVAPEPDGQEQNLYSETMTFEPIGEVVNAEDQRLAVLRYHQSVFRIRDNKRIHDQVGYWMWDSERLELTNSFAIPRGVNVIAVGKAEVSDSIVIKVEAKESGGRECISQSDFMCANAKTLSFEMTLTLTGDSLSYRQNSVVDIYGKVFDHTDENTLRRVKE